MCNKSFIRLQTIALFFLALAALSPMRAALADDGSQSTTIQAGEIGLQGVITDADPIGSHFAMQVQQLQRPQGAPATLSPPRTKSVTAGSSISVMAYGVALPAPNAVLHHGDTILAIGPNARSGQPMAARLIVVISDPQFQVTAPGLPMPSASSTAAPDFTVNGADHQPISLSDYRGKVVVLDFWATWCGPGEASLSHAEEVAAQYANKNVVVLGVNVWDKQAAFDSWITAHSQYPHIRFAIDTDQNGTRVATSVYKVHGLPTQFVIDPNGNIVKAIAGNSGPSTELASAIDTALAVAPADTAPDFTVSSVDGKPIKLSDFRGKVVLLDFWATACQESLPHTEEIARKYASKGVVVLAVNTSDRQSVFDAWIPEHRQYSHILFAIDTKTGNDNIAGSLYNVTDLPAQFVIDPAGSIVHKTVGDEESPSELSEAIDTADGVTALMKAAADGRIDRVMALIAGGADVNARTKSAHLTALMAAAMNGREDCLKALIAAGANVNAKTRSNYTALIMATMGNAACVEAMIDAAPDVNAQNNLGQTALMGAAFAGNPEMVKALIAAVADVSLKDKTGKTALMWAGNRSEIVELLKAAGANE